MDNFEKVVAIVGCGGSGLAAIRRAKEYKIKCVAFEKGEDIGGLWNYALETGINKYGLPVHCSLYDSLRVNIPTILMEHPGFSFKLEDDNCYPHREKVMQYLRDFAHHFQLYDCIKFCHNVENVSRQQNKWLLTAKDLKTGQVTDYQFDGIMVCNGHNSVPYMPEIPGIESFTGLKVHSHDYRIPQIFKDKKVCVWGGGPSALDITFDLDQFSQVTYVSHRSPEPLKAKFPKNVFEKSTIKSILGSQVTFVDGSTAEIDVLIYCTGYNANLDFLSSSCGIRIFENKTVVPLFKHIFAIPHTSLGFIGLLEQVFTFPLFDFQVCVYLRSLLGFLELPLPSEMFEDHKRDLQRFDFIGGSKYMRKFHREKSLKNYYESLHSLDSEGLPSIPDVLFRICSSNTEFKRKEWHNHRRQRFIVVSDKEFIKTII